MSTCTTGRRRSDSVSRERGLEYRFPNALQLTMAALRTPKRGGADWSITSKSGHFYLAGTGHLYLAAIIKLRIMYIMVNHSIGAK